MLTDPDVDLVDLCVPNDLHAPLAVEAARAGKHVIVEKPLTGCFGDAGDAARRDARGARSRGADAIMRGLPRGRRAALLRRELGLRAAGPEGAAPARRRRAVRSCGSWARSAIRAPHASYQRGWATAGGGSLLGKGCHPLGAALYLKADEGAAPRRRARPAASRCSPRPPGSPTPRRSAAARRVPQHRSRGRRRGLGHDARAFDDGTVAQITAADTVLGGIRNYLRSTRPRRSSWQYQPERRRAGLRAGRRTSSATSTSPRRSRPRPAGPSRRRTRTG